MSVRPDDSPHFAVAVVAVDGRRIVTACGEVDVTTAPQLRQALTEAQSGANRGASNDPVVVDLSGVTFLDASALGVLAAAAMRARQRGGEIVLRDPAPMAVRLLEITGLLQVFGVERRDGEGRALVSTSH